MHACILRKIAFKVSYPDYQSIPKIIVYSDKSIINDYGDEVNPSVNVILLSNYLRDFINENSLIKYQNYYSIIGLLSREHQFMLPFIIALLEDNTNWRLRNAECLFMDIDRLKEEYKKQSSDWAYLIQ